MNREFKRRKKVKGIILVLYILISSTVLSACGGEVFSRIERACSDRVKEIISNTLEKGQKEFKQDNFSIGVTVHQQYPKVWREIATDWKNIFPEIAYEVNVETTIVEIGLINFPANLRRKK